MVMVWSHIAHLNRHFPFFDRFCPRNFDFRMPSVAVLVSALLLLASAAGKPCTRDDYTGAYTLCRTTNRASLLLFPLSSSSSSMGTDLSLSLYRRWTCARCALPSRRRRHVQRHRGGLCAAAAEQIRSLLHDRETKDHRLDTATHSKKTKKRFFLFFFFFFFSFFTLKSPRSLSLTAHPPKRNAIPGSFCPSAKRNALRAAAAPWRWAAA